MPVVRELVTKLGFQADTAGAKKFELSLAGVRKAATALAAAGAAAGGALLAMTYELAAAGNTAAKQARMFGLSVQSYQELSHAAEQSGASIAEVTDVMKDLSKNAYDAVHGNVQFAEMFKRLGVTLTDSEGKLRSQEDLFMDVAEGMKSLTDDTERLALSEKLLGGSAKKLQPLFDAGREGIAAMRAEARGLGIVLGEDVVRGSEKFTSTVDGLRKAFRGVRYTIGAAVMPAITEYAAGIRDLFIANREVLAQNIGGALKGLVAVLRALLQPLFIVVGLIRRLVAAMGGLAKAARIAGIALAIVYGPKLLAGLKMGIGLVTGMGKAFTWLRAKALMAHAAMLLIVTAIALVIEDIYQFFTGGESLAGRLMDWLDTCNSKIASWYRDNVRPIFEWIADKLMKFIEALDAIGGKASAIREIGEALGLSSTESEQVQQQRRRAAGTLSKEQRSAIEQRAREVGAARGLSEAEVRRLAVTMAARQAERKAAPGGAAVTVGQVAVTVQGTADMNEEQMRRAVSAGVRDGLAKPLRDLQAATAGGVE